MTFTLHQKIILWFSALYVLGFSAYYVSIRDFEFLWYVAVLVFFFILIFATLKRSQFPPFILWGLSLWGLLHMAGGGIMIGDHVLYAQKLLPIIDNGGEFIILKFDQFVHFFGFGVATLVVYHLLKPYLNERTNYKVVYPLVAVAGTGLGVLNEIVEFTAVLAFPETGVGGYTNTALDLVFNTIGAIVAVFVIHFWIRKRQS
jgi:uncharacterized membrane protein YjdF